MAHLLGSLRPGMILELAPVVFASARVLASLEMASWFWLTYAVIPSEARNLKSDSS